jgi:drug/metabolite transporter (DMT)-like permease
MKIVVSFKARIALLIAVSLWASAFVGIRVSLQGYTPGGLALLRFIVASFFMLIIQMKLPERRSIALTDKAWLLLVGVFGLGFYHIALNYGELSVPSGISSFIISLSPLVTREIISINMIIGMIVSIIGVALIMLGKINDYNFHIGVFEVMIATFVGGVYSVLQKPFLKKYHAIEVTAYIIWGTMIFLLYYLPEMVGSIKTASLQSTMAAIYLGVFPAAIGYLAWSYGLKEMSATEAANYLYLMPLIATLLGWIWLGEIPGWLAFFGGLIALFGVWIVNQPKMFSKRIVNVAEY